MRVAHDEEDFQEESETILTLRDTSVLDSSDGVLENAAMVAKNKKEAEQKHEKLIKVISHIHVLVSMKLK